MKQKFTLNIADIQISVIADAAPEEVEHIRGLLDRKMREIYLKSRCPKTEAALLCAMDFAADRMNLQNQIAEMDERCEKYALVLENLKERNADQTAELERLRGENAVLRSLLTKDAEVPAAPDPISPAAFFAEVADAQTQNATLFEDTEEEEIYEEEDETEADPDQIEVFDQLAEAPRAAEPAPVKVEFAIRPEPAAKPEPAKAPTVEKAPAEEAPRPRSRVGAMFRHLSFGDVD